MKKRQLASLFTLCLLVGVGAACGLWVRAQQRQHDLNRQLIAALMKSDDNQALMLIHDGADPNTRYTPTPVPPLLQLAKRILYRSPQPINDNPTALLIACGATWDSDRVTARTHFDRPDAAQLVQAMLQHGAKVNLKDKDGYTPLLYAVRNQRRNTLAALLEHGAEVNVKVRYGFTPLMYAIYSPPVMHLLLEHGAEVNAQDDKGYTALFWIMQNLISPMHTVPYTPYDPGVAKECIRQLVARGANPNLPDWRGMTPMYFSEINNCPQIIALLRQAGVQIKGK